MQLPLLLHELQYVKSIDPVEMGPVEIDDQQFVRYMEWRFEYHENVKEKITEDQFIQIPQKGLDKPDGFYAFTFSGGCIYVEVQNKQLQQMSGYASSELNLFGAITREYGEQIREELQEAIQRATDAARASGKQSSEVYFGITEVQGPDQSNCSMDL